MDLRIKMIERTNHSSCCKYHYQTIETWLADFLSIWRLTECMENLVLAEMTPNRYKYLAISSLEDVLEPKIPPVVRITINGTTTAMI